jgi:hypothetical protein
MSTRKFDSEVECDHRWRWGRSDSGYPMRLCSRCKSGNGNDFWDEIRSVVGDDGDEEAFERLASRADLPADWIDKWLDSAERTLADNQKGWRKMKRPRWWKDARARASQVADGT